MKCESLLSGKLTKNIFKCHSAGICIQQVKGEDPFKGMDRVRNKKIIFHKKINTIKH